MGNNISKARLRWRWRQVNQALTDLTNLHIWPTDKDITQFENELFEELGNIEDQLALAEDL